MPGQFMKQESFMGLNLICRNRSFIRGIHKTGTAFCKKKILHTGDTDSLNHAMQIEAPILKENPFEGEVPLYFEFFIFE